MSRLFPRGSGSGSTHRTSPLPPFCGASSLETACACGCACVPARACATRAAPREAATTRTPLAERGRAWSRGCSTRRWWCVCRTRNFAPSLRCCDAACSLRTHCPRPARLALCSRHWPWVREDVCPGRYAVRSRAWAWRISWRYRACTWPWSRPVSTRWAARCWGAGRGWRGGPMRGVSLLPWHSERPASRRSWRGSTCRCAARGCCSRPSVPACGSGARCADPRAL